MFQMFDFVVGNVQNGKISQLLNILDFSDLVFLHIQLLQCVFEGNKVFVDLGDFVGLDMIEIYS